MIANSPGRPGRQPASRQGQLSGITHFDASLGGMGGCPFVPGAKGNIATEDLVNMVSQMGMETGYDLDAAIALAVDMGGRIQAKLSSSMSSLCKKGH